MAKLNSVLDELQEAVIDDDGSAAADGEDFVGLDGLLMCGQCGKPKQMKVSFPWKDKPDIVAISGECQKQAERLAEEKEAQANAKAKAERMRKECFLSSGVYRDCTFEVNDGKTPYLSKVCLRYADTFEATCPYGLLLHGAVGTGKSFMASAIANRVIDRGFSAFHTDIRYIVNLMEASFDHRQRDLDRILNYDLLLIEDLGAQRNTSYMMEHVYTVIDGRYKNGKPMIITTNIDVNKLGNNTSDEPWNRIFDRILERCYPVKFTGENRRTYKKKEMMDVMKARLCL